MPNKFYIGDTSNQAKQVSTLYIGNESNLARRVVKVYVGDANNEAKQVIPAPGSVTFIYDDVFVVPAGVFRITVRAVAGGGRRSGI